MDAFGVLNEVLDDYRNFVTGFLEIKDDQIRAKVEAEIADGLLWPEPWLALNPAFESGGRVGDLVTQKVLHPEATNIFRARSEEDPIGREITFHRHQTDAFEIANRGESYVLTTGTGSGKSMAYIVPIVDRVLIASTEFRRFCADKTAKAARRDLRRRRNDESHQRKVQSHELAAACNAVTAQLEVLLKQLSFFLDSPLALARELRWDSLDRTGSLMYQKLSGDHPVVPIREITVNDPGIESGSLYLLDSDRKLHLLRPFLVGMNCDHCGAFSIFHIDRLLDGRLTMKSMEHGHQIDAPDHLQAAARRTGLLKA